MYRPKGRPPSSPFDSHSTRFPNIQQIKVIAQRLLRICWLWITGTGKQLATSLSWRVLVQGRRNLTARRIVAFPHLVVLFWFVLLLWGERWVFDSKVKHCAWENWEKWPRGATPHHLIFVADPQITDPHSYPGRPWPLNDLTVMLTDNYLRRGYGALQSQLHPDSVFFLGDLFDGGREWKTRLGKFVDPKWGLERHDDEKAWVDTWHRKYGEDYWLREYERFGSIFFDQWSRGGDTPGKHQRGRKFVASLPGNHDLGFGAQVQVPVRDRFEAYFGDVNRVDVVGNHTIVSVDSVSLSADTSFFKDSHDLSPIYGPVNEFLRGIQVTKQKAVERELEAWYGKQQDLRFKHAVEELDQSDLSKFPKAETRAAGQGPEFPTLLLTHVPLYRDPGTPCGKLREHWPPAKPPKGQTEPVSPDPPNAILVEAGYQYQNVLSEEDSVKLIQSVGNVQHVFSGDDHDYCEIIHSAAKQNVKEITVKSLSMVMSVANPGFLMVSLYNPVDENGKSLASSSNKQQQPVTLQTHLCLLPNQGRTFKRYLSFAILSLVLFSVRAYLVPILNLTPFALDPESPSSLSQSSSFPGGSLLLPTYKDKKKKMDPPESRSSPSQPPPPSSSTGAGTSSTAFPSRMRSSSSLTSNGQWSAKRSSVGRRGWGLVGGGGGQSNDGAFGGGPRIDLDSHRDFYSNGGGERRRGWKVGSGRMVLGIVGRELWTTSWRWLWMVVLIWACINRNG